MVRLQYIKIEFLVANIKLTSMLDDDRLLEAFQFYDTV